MTTDRELLEMAARAAGIPGIYREVFKKDGAIEDQSGISEYFGYRWWNPRTSDGDCACMEAALGISVDWSDTNVMCGAWNGAESESVIERFESHKGDKQAARRMASLRVAAAIGKAMP